MRLTRLYHEIFPKRFGTYWEKIKNKSNLDDDIKNITNAFIKSESYKYVSNFWHILNINNYRSLLEKGLINYGSTLARNYSTYTDFNEEYLIHSFDNLKDTPQIAFKGDIFKKQKNFNYKHSFAYNYLCLLLYANLKKTTYFNHLHKLNDKTYLGFNDPFITIDGTNVSTDKIISLFDLEKINSFNNLENVNRLLEFGSGSGRLSECILTFYNKINYVICDIPPAIYIAFKRLKLAFPNKKISLLINNNSKESLEEGIKNNDISFIFPNQLKLLNNKLFDIVIAIDCFHEFDKKVLKLYFRLINNLTSNFYFSIWNRTKNFYYKYDKIFKEIERLDFEKGDYPIPKNWKNVFKKNLIFPSNQLGLGYNIK
jgi:putative sugar O-methyltransferase|tara:strand:+ start:132 stop:1241 length:1110 start_codon:yes stop_codon:yes gene_type:complete